MNRVKVVVKCCGFLYSVSYSLKTQTTATAMCVRACVCVFVVVWVVCGTVGEISVQCFHFYTICRCTCYYLRIAGVQI